MWLHAGNGNVCMGELGTWRRLATWLAQWVAGAHDLRLEHSNPCWVLLSPPETHLLGNGFLNVPACVPLPVTSLVLIREHHH